MSPPAYIGKAKQSRAPRVSGDEPYDKPYRYAPIECSPRERG